MRTSHLPGKIHSKRRAIAALTYSLISVLCWPQSSTFDGDRFFEADAYKNGILAVAVTEGDKVVYAREERKAVSPASCLKLITTAAAWAKLGADYRSHTLLSASGTLSNDGTLNGSLYIVGGGDPTLGSDKIKGSMSEKDLLQHWQKAIAAAGIKRVQGDIVADTSAWTDLPVPGGWNWTDIGNYYGAGVYALNYHDNLYHLYMQPGAKVGADATVTRTEPVTGLIWDSYLSTAGPDTGDRAYIYSAPKSGHAELRGTIPLGGEFSIRGSLPDPPLTAAQQLRNHLNNNGIEVLGSAKTGKTPEDTKVVDKLPSPPLSDIARTINNISFNIYAEALLLHAADTTEPLRRSKALAYEEDFLTKLGVDTNGFDLRDGSGLSATNKVTARGMTEFLHGMRSQPSFSGWKNSINVYGTDEGQSRRRGLNSISGAVTAKTGTISSVRGFCGYLKTASGKELEFAVIGNYLGGGSNLDSSTDQLLNALHKEY